MHFFSELLTPYVPVNLRQLTRELYRADRCPQKGVPVAQSRWEKVVGLDRGKIVVDGS